MWKLIKLNYNIKYVMDICLLIYKVVTSYLQGEDISVLSDKYNITEYDVHRILEDNNVSLRKED